MTIIQSIVLGLIEGVTEFLPVSSTAHLIVGQKILGIETVNEFFTTVVQLGAIAALIVAERRRLLEIFREFLSTLQKHHYSPLAIRDTLAAKLLIASVPVLLVGFLVKDQVAALQNNLPLVACMSIAIAIVLYAAERSAKKFSTSHQPARNAFSIADAGGSLATSRQLFIMGVFQTISLIPGVSRSGITAAGGAFQKMTLAEALEYSFLLSIPALLAAGGYEMLKFAKAGVDTAILTPTIAGTVVAFIAAMISIEWLRGMVKRRGFLPFVIYRIIFGLLIFLL